MSSNEEIEIGNFAPRGRMVEPGSPSDDTTMRLLTPETTPKPSLVDRRNSGAHRDMNIGTFNEECVRSFDPEILDLALQSGAVISMIVDPAWRDETMKVIISNNRVVQMSKKISRDQYSGTYIGVTTFRKEAHDRLFRKMGKFIYSGRVNEFFNVAVQELVDEGERVGFTTTDGLAWAEIDDPMDLTFAQQYIFP